MIQRIHTGGLDGVVTHRENNTAQSGEHSIEAADRKADV